MAAILESTVVQFRRLRCIRVISGRRAIGAAIPAVRIINAIGVVGAPCPVGIGRRVCIIFIGTVRNINENLSIRKSTKGDYIFFKSSNLLFKSSISLNLVKFEYNKYKQHILIKAKPTNKRFELILCKSILILNLINSYKYNLFIFNYYFIKYIYL